eukprot:SAG31_NODE_3679_length_3994_cov_3.349422_5_plen_37_part_00
MLLGQLLLNFRRPCAAHIYEIYSGSDVNMGGPGRHT